MGAFWTGFAWTTFCAALDFLIFSIFLCLKVDGVVDDWSWV